MDRHLLTRLCATMALTFALPISALSDVYVVVDKNSQIAPMTKKEVVAIYTGKTKALPNGGFAKPIDHPDDSIIKSEFYQTLTNRSVSQINSYWARLVFSGRYAKPEQISSEEKIQEYVAENSGAIAYVSKPNLDLVKVVYTIKSETP